MNIKTLPIIKREYLTRVKTKGFIIGTLFLPVFFVLIFGGIFLFASLFQPKGQDYVIIDRSGFIYDDFIKIHNKTLKDGSPKFKWQKYDISGKSVDEAKEEINAKIRSKEIDACFIIPEDIVQSKVVTFLGRNVSDLDGLQSFNRTFNWLVSNKRMEMKGYDADIIREEMDQGKVLIQSIQVTDKGEVGKNSASNFLLTYILGYFLFLFIMSYGQTVTRSVIEEKSQRITETIISSIRPIELMMGKLIGICLVGITQLVVIAGFLYIFTLYGDDILLKAGVGAPKLLDIIRNLSFTPVVFGYFILFFLFGYLIYGAIFAAIGAMVNTEDEGQQFLTPVVLLNLVSFFIMFTVAKNPDTVPAMWVSLVPFFTPVVMFARIAAMDPVLPSAAIISIFTTGLSVYGLLLLVAKIYRVGILMYGKKPSLKEAIKWIKY